MKTRPLPLTSRLSFFVWVYGAYLLITQLPILLAANFLTLSTPLVTVKELFFSLWVYGWDGGHYIDIARNGYHFPLQGFFPGYPLLLRSLDAVLPLGVAGRINILLIPLLLTLLWRLLNTLNVTIEQKKTALAVFLFFPLSFFLQANYPETLYLCFSVGVFLALASKRFLLAALLAGCASGIRPQGVVLVGIILWEWWRTQTETLSMGTVGKAIGIVMLSLWGALTYAGFLIWRYGSLSIYFEAQREWFRGEGDVFTRFFHTMSEMVRMVSETVLYFPRMDVNALHSFFFLFFVFVAWKSIRTIPRTWWVFGVAQVMLPVLSGGVVSSGRFLVSAFPLLLGWGLTLCPPRAFAVIALSSALQALLIVMFFNNVFVG